MESFAKIIMLGRCSADPTRHVYGQTLVARFGFVVNLRRWSGEKWIDAPMWIRCDAVGELAEFVLAEVRRGYALLVDGGLRQEEWVDKEKKPQKAHRVTVTEVKVLDRYQKKNPAQKSEPPKSEPGKGDDRKQEEPQQKPEQKSEQKPEQNQDDGLFGTDHPPDHPPDYPTEPEPL